MGEAMANTPVEGVTLPEVLPRVRLHDLRVSHRVKYLIQTGEDPDDPTRYYSPDGTPDRSRAPLPCSRRCSAGHDDATLASVVMDERYGISAKVLSQKNAQPAVLGPDEALWRKKSPARRPNTRGHGGPHGARHDPGRGPAAQWSDARPHVQRAGAAPSLQRYDERLGLCARPWAAPGIAIPGTPGWYGPAPIGGGIRAGPSCGSPSRR